MASPPPGWYDDPAGSALLRYWDGSSWTDRLADRPGQPEAAQGSPEGGAGAGPAPWPFDTPPAPDGPNAPNAPAGAAAPQTHQADPGRPAGRIAGRPAGRIVGRTAADGAPLAPWWRRLLAWIVDQAICTLVALPMALALLATRWEQLDSWTRSAQDAAARGAELPVLPDALAGAIAAAGVAGTLVYFLYELIGLTRWGTTVGRRMVGIRVRGPGGAAGPLSLQAASRRSAVKVAGAVIGGAPALATLGTMVMLFDLGRGVLDRDRRTLHDLVGRTDVVLARRGGDTASR